MAPPRSFTYDNNDNVLTVTDERGNTTTFTYDANNNLTAIADALGQTTTVAHDGLDRVTTVTDPLGNSAVRTYDEFGRLETVTGRTANTTTFSYDARGRLTSVTDGEGNVWPRTHDLESMLASAADPLAHTTSVTSDTMGRVTRLTSPLGNMTDLVYDTMGRVTSVDNPLNETTTRTYDARGQLAATTIADGAITAALARNTLGQITTITDSNANDWIRAFDVQGRLTSRTDPLGNQQTFDYDIRNRVSRVNLPASTLDLTYDATGNVTRRLFSDGTDLTMTFDALNRLTTANNVSMAYDANGRITNSNGLDITRDADGRITGLTVAPGKTVTYSYDSRSLLTLVTDWLGAATTFSYDAASQLIAVTRPNGVTTTVTYDDDGRVSGMAEGSLASIALTRDANGQITSSACSVPLSPVVMQGAATALSYDAASQVAGFSYDTLGRLIAEGARTYTWDLASRLTSVSDGASVTFGYDGLGARISRTAGMTTRDFVVNYALGLPSVSVVSEGGGDLRYYIHTPAGALLYSIEAADNSRRDYHYDEIGNTLFLTDASGAVVASYAYSPYGEILDSTGSSVDNPFTWQGRFGVMQEGTSGLYYMRARYYDSATGRFISRDPVKSVGAKSINPYQYALANPLRFVDPSGEEPNQDASAAVELATFEGVRFIDEGEFVPDPFNTDTIIINFVEPVIQIYSFDFDALDDSGDLVDGDDLDGNGTVPHPAFRFVRRAEDPRLGLLSNLLQTPVLPPDGGFTAQLAIRSGLLPRARGVLGASESKREANVLKLNEIIDRAEDEASIVPDLQPIVVLASSEATVETNLVQRFSPVKASTELPRNLDGALALDIAHHVRNRILPRNADAHVDQIRQRMSFYGTTDADDSAPTTHGAQGPVSGACT